jgi:hypothetical protein
MEEPSGGGPIPVIVEDCKIHSMTTMAIARKLLRRRLSPQAYKYVDFSWWIGRHYLPRLGASFFVRRAPKVQNFPNLPASRFAHQLRSLNVVALTSMCYTMSWHGSDKGGPLHNYTTTYSAIFGELRNKPLRILELGLGSNNPNFPYYMGVGAKPGASLRGWRELFPHALVYGADIDRDILFEEDRIKTFYCDQLDEIAIRDLWSQPDLRGGMDIIVDDGHHTFEANSLFLDGSLGRLRPGGTYVIEDIQKETLGEWQELLRTIYPKRFPNHEFAIVEMPNSLNDHDNNLVVIRRHA